MPLTDFDTGPQSLRRLEVVGSVSGDGIRFVKHVGYSDEDVEVFSRGESARAIHMSPPFERGGEIVAHVVGSVPLTNDEVREIDAWFAEIEDEYDRTEVLGSAQYVIEPPIDIVKDDVTGAHRYTKYSCSGFVIDGYAQVGLRLVDMLPERLPCVDADTLCRVYGVTKPLLTRFGLGGNGPWHVVLPGYVIKSLSRSTESIRAEPYVAEAGDESI